MSELVLAPTSATTEGTGSDNDPYLVAGDVIGGTVAGSSPTAWTDGLDTSYVKSDAGRSSKGIYPLWSDAAPGLDAGSVFAIGVRFRAMTPSSDPAAYFIPQLFGQVSKLLSQPSYGGIPPLEFAATDTWQDFDYIISPGEYDTGGWAPDGVQSALEQTFLYARILPTNVTGEFLGDGLVYVAEQRIVLYYGDIEFPCDTWVELDLSTAIILYNSGTLSAQYADGVIFTTTDFLYPDFWVPGVRFDPTYPYLIRVTYAPGSVHDNGGREVYVAGLRSGHEQDDTDAAYGAGGEYSGAVAVWYDTNVGVTGDVQTVMVGPGRGPGPISDDFPGLPTWDDPTLGVAAGYSAPWFETDVNGAVEAIAIRRVCDVLRLTGRDDARGASTAERTHSQSKATRVAGNYPG